MKRIISTLFRYKRTSICVVGLMCCLMVILVFFLLRDRELEKIRTDFLLTSQNRLNALQREIEADLEVLQTFRSIYDSSDSVTREEFKTFARHAISRQVGIQTLEWIPRVKRFQREFHESSTRTKGFADYQITERKQQEKIVRAEDREEYYPVYYVEPYTGNEFTLGFDLASDPKQLEALTKSRDIGSMVATGRINLMQKSGKQFGISIFQPIYKNEDTVSSVEERGKNLVGFVRGVFRLGDILAKSMAYSNEKQVNHYLLDQVNSNERELLGACLPRVQDWQLGSVAFQYPSNKASLQVESLYKVAERIWVMVCEAQPEFISQRRGWQSWVILICGLAFSLFISSYLKLNLDRTDQNEKFVATLSEEISERKQIEENLRSSEERWRKLFQYAPDAYYVNDLEGNFIDCNKKAEEMVGHTKAELSGKNLLELNLLSENDIPKAIEALQLNAEDKIAGPAEFVVHRKNGEQIIAEIRTLPLTINNQKLVLGIARDITQSQHAEQSLRESEEKFRKITTYAQEAIIMADEERRVTFWNEAAEQMFGYTSQEAVGHDFQTLIIPERNREALRKRFINFQKAKIASAVKKFQEFEGIKKDKTEFPIELSLSAMHLKDRWQALCIIRDISERRVLEAQLVQAQKLESIGQLAAGIAHEINTPTQYVSYNTRFLQEQFEQLNPLFDRYRALFEAAKDGAVPDDLINEIDALNENIDLDFMREEIPSAIKQSLEGLERVSEIVRAMKEFSHPGSEEKTLIDINKAIESTITVARNEWKYVAEIETHLEHDMPLVPCLPKDFNQVILNIIINAAHAIANVIDGESNQKGTISVSTGHSDGWAEVRIKDSGCGIPEAHRSRIFDPFFTTKEVGRGTGQGLAISHSVVTEKHGGTLNFETEEGKGTTFIIRLPLK
jgi:PAS domain S-box-containing protein